MLLHGWGFDAEILRPLARAFPAEFNVSMPDVPGYGMDGDCTLPAIGNALAPAHDCVIVGWSLGGNVAIDLASRYPHRVRALALLCCSPSFLKRPHWPCGLDRDALIGLRAALAEDPQLALREFAGWCAMGERSVKQSRRALLAGVRPDLAGSGNLQRGLKMLQDLDQRMCLARVQCPVLMLFAGEDRLVPIETADFCAGLSDRVQAEVVDACGHGMPISLPGSVAARVSRFVGQ